MPQRRFKYYGNERSDDGPNSPCRDEAIFEQLLDINNFRTQNVELLLLGELEPVFKVHAMCQNKPNGRPGAADCGRLPVMDTFFVYLVGLVVGVFWGIAIEGIRSGNRGDDYERDIGGRLTY